MKNSFVVLLIISFGLFNIASVQEFETVKKLNWLSFEEMEAAQLIEHRNVIVDVYADWCFWCKKMEKESLLQEEIANCISENYYLVRFNAEDEKKISLKGKTYFQKEYKYTNSDKTREVNALAVEWMGTDFVYPSLVILDYQLNKLTIFDGYKSAKELDPIVNYFASEAYLKTKWSSYIKTFKSSIKE